MATDDGSMSLEERRADLMARLQQPAYVSDPTLLQILIDIGFDVEGMVVHEFVLEFTLGDLLKSLAATKPVWGDGSLVLVSPKIAKDYMDAHAIFVIMVKKVQQPTPATQGHTRNVVDVGWYFEGWNNETAGDLQEYVRCFVSADFHKGYFQCIRGGPNPWNPD